MLPPSEAWRAGRVPLNAAEGFIRQILGWREYVRGIYWLKMPEYAGLNALGADGPLPWFYWTGETDMDCLRQVLDQTRREAYSHHIQRLMVTGNFALLAGVVPGEICAWYLAVYADAYEWVELPNILGMVMHADGGFSAPSPMPPAATTSTACRICRGCRYDVEHKAGPGLPLQLPLLELHDGDAARLERNPRLRSPTQPGPAGPGAPRRDPRAPPGSWPGWTPRPRRPPKATCSPPARPRRPRRRRAWWRAPQVIRTWAA